MSSLKVFHGTVATPTPLADAARDAVATALRALSAALARLSRRIARPRVRPDHGPGELEFHGEAGAPEGALYVDGRLIGWVTGVTRL